MAKRGRVVVLTLAVALLAMPAAASGLVQVDVPTDSSAMDAHVTAEGDAAWTITYRVELSTEDRRAAFEDLEADIATDDGPYLDRFRERMAGTIATAENATGRSMTLENLSVSTNRTGVPAEYGLLTYRFRWTNFARVEDERIHAGDALAGLFLDEDTSLTVGWPEGYERASVAPSPTTADNQSVTWRGPRDFGADEPRVVAEPVAGDVSFWLPAVVLLVGGAALAVVVAWRQARRQRREGAAPASSDAPTDESPAGTAAADEPPEELLSNEERVTKLLEEEGGRIKQQEIADRLEWTDAKTSQVVGDLREAGEVETFRIGRENVVTLPNHEL